VSSKLRQPLGYSGHPYQGALPLDGAILDRVTVGAAWTEIDPAGRDLVVLRVPAETKRVLLLVSDAAVDREGIAALEADGGFVLDAGYFEFCTDRDGTAYDRYWLAIDPTDATEAAAQAVVQVIKAGAR